MIYLMTRKPEIFGAGSKVCGVPFSHVLPRLDVTYRQIYDLVVEEGHIGAVPLRVWD